jgi:hypothetical protein
MEPLKTILEQAYPHRPSVQEIAASYSHIQLTEEEALEGEVWAKQRKHERITSQDRREREAENRRFMTDGRWTADQTDAFMIYRASQHFNGDFRVDDENRVFYRLMCMYFSADPAFVVEASKIGVVNPSISKGILLTGNVGNGKTWFMKLFSKNKRQIFFVKSAKEIADTFEHYGEDSMAQIVEKTAMPVNDKSAFYQTHAGLCIDDLGTEGMKTHYGNKKNVIGDLIELRYLNGNTGPLFHATTNLTTDMIDQIYGSRVRSRMREIFNFIELTGKDRRK